MYVAGGDEGGILYCCVNKLFFLLHRSQKWDFSVLEGTVLDTPSCLFPGSAHTPLNTLIDYPRLNQAFSFPAFHYCAQSSWRFFEGWLVHRDKPSWPVSIRKALVDGTVIR